MTTTNANAGCAEMLLISDFPIDESHLQQVRQLFGELTTDADIVFSPERRICRWPLRVPYECGEVRTLSFQVYLCAGFLKRRSAIVDKIHALGCNLELCIHVTGIAEYFSIASGTLRLLADLDIQFSLMPTNAQL